jgi:hypothetical protein
VKWRALAHGNQRQPEESSNNDFQVSTSLVLVVSRHQAGNLDVILGRLLTGRLDAEFAAAHERIRRMQEDGARADDG